MHLLNPYQIKQSFPILQQKVYGKPLVYLDNAATTQKPQAVIDAITHYYSHMNANVHRSMHKLANSATQAIENVRYKVQRLIHSPSSKEIIFTSGTTAALNLIASTYAKTHLQPNEEVLVSHLEHHSNLLPWQHICATQGASLKIIPITPTGFIDIQALAHILSKRTKIVAVSYASNLFGTINALPDIIHLAHQYQAIVVVDAAQAIAHLPVNVQALDCDFLVFSSHKMYGPTGLGVLYGKADLLETMPPYQLGGGIVKSVDLEKPLYEDIPHRFEAGTPHIAGILGLGAAINFLNELGFDQLQQHEADLLDYAQKQLANLPHIHLLPTEAPKIGIISFIVQGMHSLDVGLRLESKGIAVRTGHHCASPLIDHLNLTNQGVVRISFAVYNTRDDVDILIKALSKLKV